MLDYTKYLKKTYRFILNYEVINDEIIIHYAKEETLVIPYTKEAEITILMLMKEQIISAKDIFSKLSEKHLEFDNFFPNIFFATSLAYSLLEKQYIVLLFAASFLGISLLRKKNNELLGKILEDFEKNKFFIENEEKCLNLGITINDLEHYTKNELETLALIKEYKWK